MKRAALLLTAALFFTSAGYGAAAQDRGCARKVANIEKEMAYARDHGNLNRVEGLETALENVKRWCDDDSLLARAEMKIVDKQEKVMEREKELEKARSEGKTKKVAKREKKLAEAKAELEEAVRKRDALR